MYVYVSWWLPSQFSVFSYRFPHFKYFYYVYITPHIILCAITSTSEAIVFLLLPKELTGPPLIFSLPLTQQQHQMIFCFVYFCRWFKSVLEIVVYCKEKPMKSYACVYLKIWPRVKGKIIYVRPLHQHFSVQLNRSKMTEVLVLLQ